MRTKKSETVERLVPVEMVLVAPSRSAYVPATLAHETVAKHCLARWQRQEDGTYTPVPLPYRWARLTAEVTAMMGFGVGLNGRARRDTILRLAAAGFLEVAQVSPGVWIINVDSWMAHLQACIDDPFRWEKGQPAREQYDIANCMGSYDKRARRR